MIGELLLLGFVTMAVAIRMRFGLRRQRAWEKLSSARKIGRRARARTMSVLYVRWS